MTYRSSSSSDRCFTDPIIARLVRRWLRRVQAEDKAAAREYFWRRWISTQIDPGARELLWVLSKRGGAWNGDT